MAVGQNSNWNYDIEQLWKRYREGEEQALEQMLASLMDFSLRVASRTCGVYIYSDDEEASIAKIALWEAVQKYEPDKGGILLYIGKVVRHRLIDYKRKQSTRRRFFSVEFSPGIMESALTQQVEEIIDEIARQQEIYRLSQDLQRFHISLSELPRISPRQEKTRKQALESAQHIARESELNDYFVSKKRLPINMLEKRFGMNRKLLDRYRKYIITAALILIGNYEYLKEYILTSGRGKNHDA